MQSYLKTKPVWMQLLLFMGMAFGILMVVFLIGGMLLSSFTGLSFLQMSDSSNWDYNNRNTLLMVRGMLLLQFLGLFLIPSLLFAYFSDPSPLHYLGLKAPRPALYWLLGVSALLIAIPAVEWFGLLNRQINFGQSANQWMQRMEAEAARTLKFLLARPAPTDLLLNLVFIAAFAGIGEELFFRGIIQRLLIRGLRNPWMGILLTAFLFSFFHFQFLGFMPRFFLGILLGAVYWYSGSLWTAILAHFLYDAFIIVLIYFFPRYAEDSASLLPASLMPLLALASAAAVCGLIWLMKKKSTVSYHTVYADEELKTEAPF